MKIGNPPPLHILFIHNFFILANCLYHAVNWSGRLVGKDAAEALGSTISPARSTAAQEMKEARWNRGVTPSWFVVPRLDMHGCGDCTQIGHVWPISRLGRPAPWAITHDGCKSGWLNVKSPPFLCKHIHIQHITGDVNTAFVAQNVVPSPSALNRWLAVCLCRDPIGSCARLPAGKTQPGST